MQIWKLVLDRSFVFLFYVYKNVMVKHAENVRSEETFPLRLLDSFNSHHSTTYHELCDYLTFKTFMIFIINWVDII